MPYSIRLPDGRLISNIPDDLDPVAAKAKIEQSLGKLPDPTKQEEPGVLSQIASLPKEVGKGFIRGLTVDPLSGAASLAYTGAQAAGMEGKPFEETGFGKSLGKAQAALAPGQGTISEFGGGVGSMLSFLPGGLLKGGLGLATRLAQTGAVGSEEARQRADQARLEGINVGAGDKLLSQLGGTAVGFTELAPLERIANPLRAVLRGIPASKADEIAPGLFNSAKRMLATGGVEGLQEGLSNVAQDLIAKGIYNPNLDVGQSALGDAAMGASVGAFAQGAIELLTKGKRTQMYNQLKQEEQTKADEERMKGIQDIQEARNKATVNPVGFFTAQDLSPDYVDAINQTRLEQGKVKLNKFSIEDLVESGAHPEEINQLIAERTGFDGSAALSPDQVLAVAQEKNIDTENKGFADFLRRTTGSEDLAAMSQPQLHAAFKSLEAAPAFEEPTALQEGSNSVKFTQQDYDSVVGAVKSVMPKEGMITLDQAMNAAAKVKTEEEAKALLKIAADSGDLNAVEKSRYDLVDAEGSVLRTYANRADAERAATQRGLGVEESTSINFAPTSEEVITNEDGTSIRKGTFKQATGYEIRSDAAVLDVAQTAEEADAKADRMQELREKKAKQLQDQAIKLEEEIAKSSEKLEELKAEGKFELPVFKKAEENIARNNEKLKAQIVRLNAQSMAFLAPLQVNPRIGKPFKPTGYTVFDQNGNPTATFKTVDEARNQAPTVGKPKLNPEFQAQADALIKQLRPVMDRLGLAPVRLNIEKAIKTPQGSADGYYLNNLIAISLESPNPVRTLRHEGIHALKELGAFTPDQWRVLSNKAKSEWMDKYNIRNRYSHLSEEEMIEEAISDAFSDFDQTKPPVGMVGALFNKIKLFLESLGNALRGMGFNTAQGLFERVEAGEMRPSAPTQGKQKLSLDLEAQARAQRPIGEFANVTPPKSLVDLYRRVEEADSNALIGGYGGAKAAATKLGRRLNREMEAFAKEVLGRDVTDEDVSNLYTKLGRLQEPKLSLRIANRVSKQLDLNQQEIDSTSIALQTGKSGTQQFKQKDIGGLPQVVQFLEDRRAKSGLNPLDINKEEDREELSKLMAAEAMASINAGGNALEWYDSVIDSMMNIAALKYPELADDPNNQTAFRLGIAIASQGLNVEDNLAFAMKQYENFREKGRFMEIGSGEDGAAMKSNYILANEIIDKYTLDTVTKFLQTEFFVKELRDVGFKVGGELGDEVVTGSSIFGPKIGFGFYSNLSGNFEPVTMDMWFMRTVGRLTGNLKDFDPDKFAQQVSRFRNAFKQSGDDGVYADDFNESELEKAAENIENTVEFARVVNSVFSSDFKHNRELYDEGARKKSELVYAAQNVIKSYDAPKDAPQNATERRLLRDVVGRMVKKVEKAYGKRIPPASLQALIWYPEQELYKALGVKLRVTSQDYARAIKKILEKEGYDEQSIDRAAKSGARGIQPVVGKQVQTGAAPTGTKPRTTFSETEREEFLEDRKTEQVIKQERETPKRRKVIFEVAPDPNNVELTDEWRSLSQEDRLKISNDIAKKIINKAKSSIDFDGRVVSQVGSYLDDTNPSFALFLDKGDAVAVSKFLGHALSQDSMMVVSPKPAKGLDQVGAVIVDIGTQSPDKVNAIYQQLREIRVNNEQPVGGQTTMNNKMLILNYSNLSSKELAKLIDDKLGNDYPVEFADVYSAFPEKKDYDYASETNVPRGKEAIVRERSRSLRSEATRLLEEQLKQERSKYSEAEAKQVTGGKASLSAPKTPEFKQWFGKSKIVGRDGKPKVMYHGTARDITEFRPKQANAIFVTDNPEFAASFSDLSENWMVDHAEEFFTPEQIKKFKAQTRKIRAKEGPLPAEDKFNELLKDNLPTKGNILPVFVKAEDPFDYANPNHIKRLKEWIDDFDTLQKISRGSWQTIESPRVQQALEQEGFDSFYVLEGGHKNLAVYKPSQIKSATGNQGTFDINNPDIRYSLSAPDTPQFKRWFGDSEAVDENGKPAVLYHSTYSDFGVPKTNFGSEEYFKFGIHVGNLEAASNRLDLKAAEDYQQTGKVRDTGANIMPVFVKAERPLRLDENRQGRWGVDDIMRQIIDKAENGEIDSLSNEDIGDMLNDTFDIETWVGKNPESEVDSPDFNPDAPFRFWSDMESYFPGERSDLLKTFIKQLGYDSIVYKNEFEGGGDSYLLLDANQVKSATGNQGESNVNNPDIRYSLRNNIDPKTVAAIDRTTTVRPEKGFVERIIGAISPDSMAHFRQAYINKYEAIERQSGQIGKMFGSTELIADTSAIAAALQADRAAGIAAESFKRGVPVFRNGFTSVDDLKGQVKGLIPILEPLAAYKDPFAFRAFQFYAATRRGRRLTAEGREKLFTQDEINRGQALAAKFPEFKQVFDEYQKYNQGLVKFMKDTGVISDAEAKIWTQNWDYIPFYRQMDGESTAGPKVFSAIAGVGKPKVLKGGEEALADFMETVVRNSRAAIEAGMKNEAARRVVRDMLRLNQGQLVPAGTSGADIVTVKENGVTKHYQVADPLLVEALKGLNLPQLPFLEILAMPSNVLRNLVTKDPGFMIANLARDSMQAWVTSGANITPLVDTFKQAGKVLAGMSPEAEALAKAGLFGGFDFANDIQSSSRAVEKELRKRAKDFSPKDIALMPLNKIWDALDKGSTASDVATRAEIYKRVLKETGSEAEAVYQAMEVMNFSRKGNSALIRILSAVVPFLNARIQGLDVLYRSGFGRMATQNREAMQKAFITRSLTILALSCMYWALASDTDEYKTAEAETRDNYWIFGNVRIPIPFEIGTLFKVFPERILEYFFGQDTGADLKESIVRNITSTLAFNPIPQALLPIVENTANYSFFTGKPIVGMGLEGLEAKYQAGASTSILAQQIGEATNTSPVKVDNLIKGYTGTLGTYAAMMLDSVMRGEGDPTKASLKLEQMPVFKRFFSPSEGTGTISAYYDLKNEVETSTRTINFLERTGNMEDLQQYLLSKGGKLQAIKPYIQTLDKDMTMLRDTRKMVMMSQMEPDKKREVLDNIRSAEVNLTSRIQSVRKMLEN